MLWHFKLLFEPKIKIPLFFQTFNSFKIEYVYLSNLEIGNLFCISMISTPMQTYKYTENRNCHNDWRFSSVCQEVSFREYAGFSVRKNIKIIFEVAFLWKNASLLLTWKDCAHFYSVLFVQQSIKICAYIYQTHKTDQMQWNHNNNKKKNGRWLFFFSFFIFFYIVCHLHISYMDSDSITYMGNNHIHKV